jgi:hypothetical protein
VLTSGVFAYGPQETLEMKTVNASNNMWCGIPPAFLLDDRWYNFQRTNQEFSTFGNIPPWFSILVLSPPLSPGGGGEQLAHWWLQFRDVVSPHEHDYHHHKPKQLWIYAVHDTVFIYGYY